MTRGNQSACYIYTHVMSQQAETEGKRLAEGGGVQGKQGLREILCYYSDTLHRKLVQDPRERPNRVYVSVPCLIDNRCIYIFHTD